MSKKDREAGTTWTQRALEAHRRLEPDLYAKADAIAKIIDPDAFSSCRWFDGTGPDAKELFVSRRKYEQSRAFDRAWKVLVHLGIAPKTTDWPAILVEMEANGE